MSARNDSTITRFVGLDLHKHFVVVTAVNAQQEVVLRPRKISLDDLPAWAEAYLGRADAVVLEATGNAWYVTDSRSANPAGPGKKNADKEGGKSSESSSKSGESSKTDSASKADD